MTRRSRSPPQAAYVTLRAGFLQSSAGLLPDDSGYLKDASLNLVEGLRLEDYEADIRQGRGNELAGKFRAVHSSTALAVNTFGPFKRHPEALNLVNTTGFSSLHFERQCPHGLGTTPPHLDVVAEAPDCVIAVESKCTEHLGSTTPDFRPAYNLGIRDERRDSPWFHMMKRLMDQKSGYRQLDAAQLVKHAFGLAHTFRGRQITLLYLFWEPTNPEAFPTFAQHRLEIQQFTQQVSGANPSFLSMSYPELWSTWEASGEPDWLAAHLARVRQRYLLPM